jgi:hypothetical protein
MQPLSGNANVALDELPEILARARQRVERAESSQNCIETGERKQ